MVIFLLIFQSSLKKSKYLDTLIKIRENRVTPDESIDSLYLDEGSLKRFFEKDFGVLFQQGRHLLRLLLRDIRPACTCSFSNSMALLGHSDLILIEGTTITILDIKPSQHYNYEIDNPDPNHPGEPNPQLSEHLLNALPQLIGYALSIRWMIQNDLIMLFGDTSGLEHLNFQCIVGNEQALFSFDPLEVLPEYYKFFISLLLFYTDGQPVHNDVNYIYNRIQQLPLYTWFPISKRQVSDLILELYEPLTG